MTMRWTRILVGPMAAMAAAFFAIGTPAASAGPSVATQYGPGACAATVTINHATVGHGGTITVSVSGTCGDDTFTIVVHSNAVTLGTITTNASGSGSGNFTLPCSVNPGQHTITATDPSGNSGSAPLTVTPAACASAGSTANGGLPITGSNSALLGGIGAGAVGLGGLIVLTSRKRRQNRFS